MSIIHSFLECGRGSQLEGMHTAARIRNSRFVQNSFGLDVLSGTNIELVGNAFERNRIAINAPFTQPALSGNRYTNNLRDILTNSSQGVSTFYLGQSLQEVLFFSPKRREATPAAGISVNGDITSDTNWTILTEPRYGYGSSSCRSWFDTDDRLWGCCPIRSRRFIRPDCQWKSGRTRDGELTHMVHFSAGYGNNLAWPDNPASGGRVVRAWRTGTASN